MGIRLWLSEVFANWADKLGGGYDPDTDQPPTANDYRVSAWTADVQSRAMRFGPWIAGACSIALLFGLVKFWQIATGHRGQPAPVAGSQEWTTNDPSAADQAASVAKRLEQGFKVDRMKQELADASGGPNLASMPSAQPTHLIYFFSPSNSLSTTYVGPRLPSANSYGTPTRRVTAIADVWGEVLRAYSHPVPPELDQDSVQSSDRTMPESGGPVWRTGRMSR